MQPDDQITKEDIQKLYDAQVNKTLDEVKDTHEKKEFTFSLSEKRRLVQQQLIVQLANQAMQDIIRGDALPRVGVPDNAQVRILFDADLGRFSVFIPSVSQMHAQVQEPSKSPKQS